jgi:hypothetical protein
MWKFNSENCNQCTLLTGVLTHAIPILQNGSDGEKEHTAKLVWELAFNKDNQQEMKVSNTVHVQS